MFEFVQRSFLKNRLTSSFQTVRGLNSIVLLPERLEHLNEIKECITDSVHSIN